MICSIRGAQKCKSHVWLQLRFRDWAGGEDEDSIIRVQGHFQNGLSISLSESQLMSFFIKYQPWSDCRKIKMFSIHCLNSSSNSDRMVVVDICAH